MKKKVIEFGVFSLFCLFGALATRFLFTWLEQHVGYTNNTLYYALLGFLFVFWLAGASYGRFWSLKGPLARRGPIAAALGIVIWFFAFLCLPAINESHVFYDQVFSDHVRGVQGRAHAADDTLGMKPVPGARYYETYRVGDPLVVQYDDRGFRVPAGGDSLCDPGEPVDLLFLGCSFSYGAGVLAEETFPYRVAHHAGLHYINAAMGSYGLAQMLVLARRLIPKYKPRYVILQYSPWLVERSIELFGPSYLGKLPFPYFYADGDSFALARPVFESRIFDIDKEALREKYKGRRWAFLPGMAFPFMIRDEWLNFKARLGVLTGRLPKPARDRNRVERYAYREMIRLTRNAGGQPVILQLGDTAYTRTAPRKIGRDVSYANADSLIMRYLDSTPTRDFDREYYIWRLDGNRPVLVDRHPNRRIHGIIAESVESKIK